MLQGKYDSRKQFYMVKAYRSLLRAVLRPLMSWQRLENPKPGYTVSVPSHWRFPHMLEASLLFLGQQDLKHMDRVICAIDCPKNAEWERAEIRMKQRFPELKLEFLYQTPLQSKVLRMINWGWVDAWLSFCKGIAVAETQYVFQHDNDAMLLDRTFAETRYRTILERGDVFLAGRWYEGNGIEESDRFAYTAELMFDAQFIRNNCHPIECFNHVCIVNGKTVDLDVLHQCQMKTEKRSVLPINWSEQWVHPSQVISQFTYLARDNGWVPPRHNNLFFIPYFEYLGGVPNAIQEVTKLLNSSQDTLVKFLGYEMDIVEMDDVHMHWIRQEIGRVEQDLFGHIRQEVELYLQAIEAHVHTELVATR